MDHATFDRITSDLDEETQFFLSEYILDDDAQRAAEVCGLDRSLGYTIIQRPEVRVALRRLRKIRQLMVTTPSDVQQKLCENLYLGRQRGQIGASNRALDQLAKLKTIDAYATSKIDVVAATDEEMVAKIREGRSRAVATKKPVDKPPLSFI